jgi:2-(1,2-epoxy-1,2-dihydrophenyl)acetyl-CoA isomerase
MSAAHGSGGEAREVLRWRDGAVAHIRFNRPAALNAIGVQLATEFREACEELEGDVAVRVVVISGAGRAFMAGGDLSALSANPVEVAAGLIDAMHGAIRLLSQLPCPVIASVQGAVAGGGLGLALSCDLCIAAAGTQFTMAYPLIGASSDCGTSWGLARLLGWRRALEIAWLSPSISAEDGERLGLVNRVVPADQLENVTSELAQRLAQGPREALAQLKALVRTAQPHTLADHLDAEREAFLACAATSDFAEGVDAFLRKRRPRFGRS